MKIHNPNNLPAIDYRRVKPLQGNLKDLTEGNYIKLKNVLEKRGFSVPLFLWQDGDEYYLMDGHQRQRVMLKADMNDDGNYKVPYIIIDASDIKEAKSRLLEVTSQYGRITQEGFDQFIAEAELLETEIYEAVHFDALSFLPVDGDDKKNGERESLPAIRITFKDSNDLNNALDEIVDMDITGKYNADIKVTGDE